MRKFHVHTTISSKHWAMLEKFTEKYETQQKALEHALECLELNSQHSTPQSTEDRIWAQWGPDLKKVTLIMQKDSYKVLLDSSDIDQFLEYLANRKPMKFAIEYVSGKPLGEMALKDLVEAVINKIKIQNTADMVKYTDEGSHYTLNISHSLGINHSKVLQTSDESIFKSYGVKTESSITESSVFIKIYKK